MIASKTRRGIFDSVRALERPWAGALSDAAFLSRLYDLTELPSYDYRYSTAEDDIWKHTDMNPGDWDQYWIFDDGRFDLMRAPDDVFLAFVCELLHPVLRRPAGESERLLESFNRYLANDGWALFAEDDEPSGFTVYRPRKTLGAGDMIEGVRAVATSLDDEYMLQQVKRLGDALPGDPELAIGTAKEVVETLCRKILAELKPECDSQTDFPKLVKATIAELKLVPDDIHRRNESHEAVRGMANALGNTVQRIAEMRNVMGTGHGKPGDCVATTTRLAKLAVGAASTLAVFLYETYAEQVHRVSTDSNVNAVDFPVF